MLSSVCELFSGHSCGILTDFVGQRLLASKGLDSSSINLSAGVNERQKAAELDELSDDTDSDEE